MSGTRTLDTALTRQRQSVGTAGTRNEHHLGGQPISVTLDRGRGLLWC